MKNRKNIITLALLMASLLLVACNGESGGDGEGAVELRLLIVAPLDGAEIPAMAYVDVTSLVEHPDGAARFELLVNGQEARNDRLSVPIDKGKMYQPWRPEAPGTYTLQVIMYSSESQASESQIITVQVGEAEVVTIALTATPTRRPTTQPVEDVFGPALATGLVNANCRKGSDAEHEIVGFLLVGESSPVVGVNFDNSWWVIEDTTGEGTCWIFGETVEISGDISGLLIYTSPPLPVVEIEPDEDEGKSAEGDSGDSSGGGGNTVSIPAPTTNSPSGSSACVSSIFLDWNHVTNPPADQYEWKVSNGGTQTGSTSSTTVEVFISCGTTYQWQVRAVDSNGNKSPYSSAMTIIIN